MKKFWFAFIAFILFFTKLSAQETASALCAKRQIHKKAQMKTTIADPAEDFYDIKHVKLDLKLNNISVNISGAVTTTATVVAPSMNVYVFELNDQYIIDSVLINNQSMAISSNGDVHTVTLTSPLSQNATFTAQVFYHGAINSGTAFYSTGIRNQASPTWGNLVTYTMSEPYDSKDWWPVKQSLTDKIDSADIWLTVPANLKAGSNGLLKGISIMPGNQWRYEWKTNYPTAYYLISASVAAYVDYSYYVHFPGSTDSMLVQNYVYNNAQTLPFFKSEIDSVGLMIEYLSDLFGRYPFWQEKYGHCMAPLNGGMEHQTMTTLGHFGTTLTVHELGHQWFGDNVTCGSWHDVWLNEGLASYIEYLFVEHFWTPSDAFTYMFDKHNNVLAYDTSSVYVPDTTNTSRIFDGRFTYDKGGAIVHTLRFALGNDSLFFQSLKNYQTQFAHSHAVTSDFQNVVEQTSGLNLDTFFNQWIYGKGHPVFSATWNQTGNWVSVKLNQTTTDPSVPFFHTPVELQLLSSAGDTIVKVYNNLPSQTFSFYWEKPMATVFIDPNNWLLNEFGNIVKDPTLNVSHIATEEFRIYPNPTRNVWHLTNLNEESKLTLQDMKGRIIWTGSAANDIDIPAQGLASGVYLLQVHNRKSFTTVKLIKQ